MAPFNDRFFVSRDSGEVNIVFGSPRLSRSTKPSSPPMMCQSPRSPQLQSRFNWDQQTVDSLKKAMKGAKAPQARLRGSQATLACNRANVTRATRQPSECASPFSMSSSLPSNASSRSSSEAPVLRSLAAARCARKQGLTMDKADAATDLTLKRRSLAEARLAKKEQVWAEERSARFNEGLLSKLNDVKEEICIGNRRACLAA